MSDIYFKRDKMGIKECKKCIDAYNQVLEKRYKELYWDPKDPQYSNYSKELIDCHNREVKRRLEEELWGD